MAKDIILFIFGTIIGFLIAGGIYIAHAEFDTTHDSTGYQDSWKTYIFSGDTLTQEGADDLIVVHPDLYNPDTPWYLYNPITDIPYFFMPWFPFPMVNGVPERAVWQEFFRSKTIQR